MKNKEQYRLPDGKFTTNVKRMVREWKDIYEPICNEFDLKVIGFDPKILFSKGGYTFDLPVNFCIQLRDIILAKNEYCVELRKAQIKIQVIEDTVNGLVR